MIQLMIIKQTTFDRPCHYCFVQSTLYTVQTLLTWPPVRTSTPENNNTIMVLRREDMPAHLVR